MYLLLDIFIFGIKYQKLAKHILAFGEIPEAYPLKNEIIIYSYAFTFPGAFLESMMGEALGTSK